ncbi:MAG: CARDB domain-containing protein [Aggregatilineales bacterium]
MKLAIARATSVFAALLLMLIVCQNALAQTSPAEPDPNARIIWPPPVYVLRGAFEVRGSAFLEDMFGHYLEFRPLNADLSPVEEAGWQPVSPPNARPIVEDVLGVWDTTVLEDGLYELRLTVLLRSGATIIAQVGPLRIENAPPPFALAETPSPEATAIAPSETPTQASVQPVGDPPRATARLNANVRSGDSTAYPIISALMANQTAPVVGISSTGSGWWVITLPDGSRGWVSPTVVIVTGDTTGLPAVTPPRSPAPPAAPTTTPGQPAPTSLPASNLPDAVLADVRFDRPLVSGQAFQIFLTVRNDGPVAMPSVPVACNFTPMSAFFSTEVGALGPGERRDVAITARLDFAGGINVTANCAVDVNNIVQESNEANNFFNVTTFLANP